MRSAEPRSLGNVQRDLVPLVGLSPNEKDVGKHSNDKRRRGKF